jgi:hypothetical protein
MELAAPEMSVVAAIARQHRKFCEPSSPKNGRTHAACTRGNSALGARLFANY